MAGVDLWAASLRGEDFMDLGFWRGEESSESKVSPIE